MRGSSSRFWFACSCLALVLCAPVAARATGAPIVVGSDDAAIAEPASVAAACTLAPDTERAISFIWTPPEELTSVAWRLPASSCAACAGSGLSISNVSFGVRWFKACTAQAQVSFVRATTVNGCLAPDTTQVLCGPFSYTISSTSATLRTSSLAIPAGCCVSGDVFLVVRFTGLGACASGGNSPGLAASFGPCVNCEQYVTAANIFPTMTEWCSIGATNSMWFSIAADCCLATPTQKHSWGSVKTIYR